MEHAGLAGALPTRPRAAGLHGRDQPGQRQRRRSGGTRSRQTIAGQGPSPDQQRGLVARAERRHGAAWRDPGEWRTGRRQRRPRPQPDHRLLPARHQALGIRLRPRRTGHQPSQRQRPAAAHRRPRLRSRRPRPLAGAQGHAVTGYDRNFADDGNTDASRRFLNWAPSTGFAARAATLHALPAPDGDTDQGFDAVLMISVLQHLAQPALAIREASRILRPGGRLVLSFDLACEPANFEDRQHRRSIASPARLATWLGLPETALALSPPAIRQSASELQSAGVAGMPDGLTVGGICLVKPA
ncbi:MAG: class I SAM-dependent methyltransferase [Candidatus Accumulibacter necessarius]